MLLFASKINPELTQINLWGNKKGYLFKAENPTGIQPNSTTINQNKIKY